MKITVETPKPNEEDEIIIRLRVIDDGVMKIIGQLKEGNRVTAYSERDVIKLFPGDIYYFESVDNKVFAYCEKQVFDIRNKLYEIEKTLANNDFIRISKSVVVNLNKINSVAPMLNGRLEGKLQNGEKIIISRQYVPCLKKALGI